jgi:hypothetical protein
MTLFLILFFTIYSSIHIYAFFKARTALSLGTAASISLVIFLAAMVSAPFIIRLSEKADLEFIARLTSYIGYTWLGILFLFFSFSIVLDICSLLMRFAGNIFQKDLSFMILPPQFGFFLPLFFSLVTSTYGYFEAKKYPDRADSDQDIEDICRSGENPDRTNVRCPFGADHKERQAAKHSPKSQG